MIFWKCHGQSFNVAHQAQARFINIPRFFTAFGIKFLNEEGAFVIREYSVIILLKTRFGNVDSCSKIDLICLIKKFIFLSMKVAHETVWLS